VIQERVEGLLAAGGLRMVYQPVKNLHTGRTIALEALARFPNGRPDWFSEGVGAGLDSSSSCLPSRTALDPARRRPAGRLPDLAERLPGHRRVPGAHFDALGDMRTGSHRGHRARGLTDVGCLRAARARCESTASARDRRRRGGLLGPPAASMSTRTSSSSTCRSGRDIDRDPKRRALASALIAFAESADVLVIAEGIENAEGGPDAA